MKILVLGGGGREHALVWALARTAGTELVCAPGNPGIATLARCVPVDPASVPAVLALAEAEQPALTVIGPELPLAAGVTDALTAAGFLVFGPTQAAAQLESSKAFAKGFMRRHGIPTAHYAVCEAARLAQDSVADLVCGALEKFGPRVVVKADGLAAGKGVILCDSHDEAVAAAEELFEVPGTARLVLEEMLAGPELSYFALCDGTRATTLGFAQDHKRIGEGDTGPNTGGMGAYSTDTLVSAETAAWLHTHIAQRVVDGMRAEGTPFTGVLFTGLMMTPEGPRVLEFNTRFGDPETQALLLRLETPLAPLLAATAKGQGDLHPVTLTPGAAASVVAASAGYPGAVTTGAVVTGLDSVSPDVQVFHAGTAVVEGRTVTAGGRVLTVAATGSDLPSALATIYAALAGIHFEGMQVRPDIGWRALRS